MENARFMQIRHARTDAARQSNLHGGAQRFRFVGQQLFQRSAVDVLGQSVQLTLVHADAHEAGSVTFICEVIKSKFFLVCQFQTIDFIYI